MLIHVYMNTRIICVWQKQLAASAEGLEAQFAEAMEMAMQKEVKELRRVKEQLAEVCDIFIYSSPQRFIRDHLDPKPY